MTKKLDMIGKRIGDLTVLEEVEPYVSPKHKMIHRKYKCLCHRCGKTEEVLQINLRKKRPHNACKACRKAASKPTGPKLHKKREPISTSKAECAIMKYLMGANRGHVVPLLEISKATKLNKEMVLRAAIALSNQELIEAGRDHQGILSARLPNLTTRNNNAWDHMLQNTSIVRK